MGNEGKLILKESAVHHKRDKISLVESNISILVCIQTEYYDYLTIFNIRWIFHQSRSILKYYQLILASLSYLPTYYTFFRFNLYDDTYGQVRSKKSSQRYQQRFCKYQESCYELNNKSSVIYY